MRFIGLMVTLFVALAAAFPGYAAPGDAVPASLGTGRMLLMVEDIGCPYCKKWEQDVGTGYRASEEGHAAPLVKRIKGHPDLAGIRGIAYSPTFILVDHGTEVGRIIGYAGPDFFWGELAPLMKQETHRTGSNSDTRAALPYDPPSRVVR